MSATTTVPLAEANASKYGFAEALWSASDFLNPVSARPGQACYPILVRRWRSGRVVWEGLPEECRVMHRRYPQPLVRSRSGGGDGQ